MKNKKLLCSVCFLFTFMSVLWGQSITVKGNVTSKTDGQPVIGASVVEATATANGTITDLDGNYDKDKGILVMYSKENVSNYTFIYETSVIEKFKLINGWIYQYCE